MSREYDDDAYDYDDDVYDDEYADALVVDADEYDDDEAELDFDDQDDFEDENVAAYTEDFLDEEVRTYTVQPGDGLARIGRKVGVLAKEIAKLNPEVEDFEHLEPSTVLRLS